jgi:hypothetical protein
MFELRGVQYFDSHLIDVGVPDKDADQIQAFVQNPVSERGYKSEER